MQLLTQGKTNWKFLLIVVVLAAVVGGGVWFWSQIQEIPQKATVEEEVSQKTTVEELKGIEKADILFQLEGTIGKTPWGFCVDDYWLEDTTGRICLAHRIQNMDFYIGKSVVIKGYYHGYNPAADPSDFFSIRKIETKTGDETADWQTYRDEFNRYEIKYPEGAIPKKVSPHTRRQEHVVIIEVTPLDIMTDIWHKSFEITIWRDRECSMKPLGEAFGLEFEEGSSININNIVFNEAIAKLDSDSYVIDSANYYTTRGEYCIILRYYIVPLEGSPTPLPHFDREEENRVFNQMLSTFRLEEPEVEQEPTIPPITIDPVEDLIKCTFLNSDTEQECSPSSHGIGCSGINNCDAKIIYWGADFPEYDISSDIGKEIIWTSSCGGNISMIIGEHQWGEELAFDCRDGTAEGFCGWSTYASCSSDLDCVEGGCSGEVCGSRSEEPFYTTCVWKDCYDSEAYGVECKCVENKCQWVEPVSTVFKIDSCRTIDTPGEYSLSGNLINTESEPCIKVQDLSNVIIDCKNYSITSKNENYNIYIKGVSDFKINNCKLISSINVPVEAGTQHVLRIEDSRQGEIYDNTIGGNFVTISDSSFVTIRNNTFSNNQLQLYKSSDITVRDNSFSTPTAIPLSLREGSNNFVISNFIDGKSDGIFENKIGADDIIFLDKQTNALIQGNTLQNAYECGIEFNYVANSRIIGNKINNTGLSFLCGWHYVSAKEITVKDNMVNNSPSLFWFFRERALRANEQYVYFQDNIFENNKLSNPKLNTGFSRAALMDFNRPVVPLQNYILGNNILRNNDFTKLLEPLRVAPATLVVDGGGNICSGVEEEALGGGDIISFNCN